MDAINLAPQGKTITLTEDGDVLLKVLSYYHECLKQDTTANDYLGNRGISEEAIDHFKIGYSDRTLGLQLPKKNRNAGNIIRNRLIEIGLYRDTGREHFNGSITIPIFHDGNIVQIYGRKIGNKLRKGTPLHLYLPKPLDCIFNEEALQEPQMHFLKLLDTHMSIYLRALNRSMSQHLLDLPNIGPILQHQ